MCCRTLNCNITLRAALTLAGIQFVACNMQHATTGAATTTVAAASAEFCGSIYKIALNFSDAYLLQVAPTYRTVIMWQHIVYLLLAAKLCEKLTCLAVCVLVVVAVVGI